MRNKEQSLEYGALLLDQILNLNPKGVAVVDGKSLRDYFDVSHDPSKGETSESALNDWLENTYDELTIYHKYNQEKDLYRFEKNPKPVEHFAEEEDEQIVGYVCSGCNHEQQDDYECEKCAGKTMDPIWE